MTNKAAVTRDSNATMDRVVRMQQQSQSNYFPGSNTVTTSTTTTTIASKQKKISPILLDISRSKDIQLLHEEEIKLCSHLGIPPGPYLVIKEAIMHMYARKGSLKKREAREMFTKVETSKASQIYSLLHKLGLIKTVEILPSKSGKSSQDRQHQPSRSKSIDASVGNNAGMSSGGGGGGGAGTNMPTYSSVSQANETLPASLSVDLSNPMVAAFAASVANFYPQHQHLGMDGPFGMVQHQPMPSNINPAHLLLSPTTTTPTTTTTTTTSTNDGTRLKKKP